MSEINLNFNLHPKQFQIYNSPARFVAAACGRRFGKSYVATVKALTSASEEKNKYGRTLSGKSVWYVAPTFKQGMDAVWHYLLDLGQPLIDNIRSKDGVVRLINGAEIHVKGSDRPKTLRGAGLRGVILDEYASMKPDIWDQIISPALTDVTGWALFIGTPHHTAPHFRELWERARNQEDWEAFTFPSVDNPYVDMEAEIARMKLNGVSEAVIRQEMYASFNAMGNKQLDPEKLIIVDKPPFFNGSTFITVDLNGYEEAGKKLVDHRKDETAIAVTEVTEKGWYLKDLIHGSWTPRETALKIIAAASIHKPRAVGIEKGSLKNAVMPYMADRSAQLRIFPNIVPLLHGGKKKLDRIMWALQGRLESNRLYVKKADWNKALFDQMYDFPNQFAHDDILDAWAYTDQIAESAFIGDIQADDSFEYIDAIAGF